MEDDSDARPARRQRLPECPVCCAPYTKQQRREIECLYCNYTACAACVQQYLLSVPRDAACMSCAKAWNRDFLYANLPRTWVHGAYREHRERVLLDRETALLPASQVLVDNYRTAKVIAEQLQELTAEHRQLQLRQRAIGLDSAHLRARLANVSANNYQGAGEAAVEPGGRGGEGERRAFVRACPAEGCRGFLSTAWKCGVCASYACPHCHELKGPDRDAPHECDPGNVATAALLARDTKPCPMCAAMIHKIEGCDQMWCTACNTAFSWRSGAIVTNGANIHNPHYYEFLRRQNGGRAPRNAGDVPCGGLCGTWELTNRLRHLRTPEAQAQLLHEFHRSARHVTGVELAHLAGHFNAADHADLRLKYLLNEVDRDAWKRRLQQREKKRDKDLAARQVYEMYTAAVAEGFRKLMAGAAGSKDTLAELGAILEFANSSLRSLASDFSMSINPITVVGIRRR